MPDSINLVAKRNLGGNVQKKCAHSAPTSDRFNVIPFNRTLTDFEAVCADVSDPSSLPTSGTLSLSLLSLNNLDVADLRGCAGSAGGKNISLSSSGPPRCQSPDENHFNAPAISL